MAQVPFTSGYPRRLKRAYSQLVRDIQQIRLHNLKLLLEECEDELGRAHGAAAHLASATGVKRSLLSMLLSGAVHSETGTRRQLGDDTATKLELGMHKPQGWMDVDHSMARDWREAAYLDKLRLLTASQRESVERIMDELARSNDPGAAPPPHTDIPGRPKHDD